MSYTMDQYTALTSAIAEGVKKVKYQDKEVEYRSLSEMLQLKSQMETELGLNSGKSNRTVGVYGSGL